MDALNISNWNNDSVLLQDLPNNSVAQLREHIATKVVLIPSLPIFLVVVLGLPGNLFVMAVYLRQMTTSTRVYMFGLAVADTAVCMCAIVLTSALIDYTTVYVILYFIDLSITASIYLLAFVSTERLVAVWRPHSFSRCAFRAKAALALIVVAALLSASVLTIARLHHYKRLSTVFPMLVTLFSVLVMIICYTLVAIKLLKNATAAHTNVGVLTPSQSLPPGPSTVSHTLVGKGERSLGMNKMPVKQVNTYRGVLLLFIVTVVFIACWLPQWLAYVGVSVSDGVRRIFLLNSAVNPFIYSVASAMFRDDVKQFYHKTLGKLIARCH